MAPVQSGDMFPYTVYSGGRPRRNEAAERSREAEQAREAQRAQKAREAEREAQQAERERTEQPDSTADDRGRVVDERA